MKETRCQKFLILVLYPSNPNAADDDELTFRWPYKTTTNKTWLFLAVFSFYSHCECFINNKDLLK